MTDNEALLRRAEGVAAMRRFLLVINALSYVAWISVFAISISGVHLVLPPWAGVAAGVCAVIWFVSLIALLLGIRSLRRNRALAGLVDDERTQHLRGRAFEAAYWVLLFAVAILYGLAGFVHLESRLVLPALIGLGVAVPGLTFAWLYRA